MSVTPSQLRADIYRLLEEVLETGVPLEVERGGRRGTSTWRSGRE